MVEFIDNRISVRNAMQQACIRFLNEAGGELAAQTACASRADTGQLRGSWRNDVDEGSLTATVGSPLENALWEEFGTGEFAENGGRQGGWVYVDRHGVGHFTRGKKPQRTFRKSYERLKPAIKRRAEQELGRTLD